TAVNVELLPATNNTINLGSSSLAWKDVYLNGNLYLDGSRFISNFGTSNVFVGLLSGNSNLSTAWYNCFAGSYAGYSNTSGYSNSLFGDRAGYSNTTGILNTCVGKDAGYSNTVGDKNTVAGASAFHNNTTGDENTAVGFNASYYQTSGSLNNAFGAYALQNNLDGESNTAVGSYSLYSTASGSGNVAVGLDALYATTNDFATGYNTAIGSFCMFSNTSGIFNSALGYGALHANTTGSSNIGIGLGADVSAGNLSNATVIGININVDASNKVRIGNSSVLSNGGQVSWTAYSDGRIKNDVQENVPGLEFIKALRPVTFHYDVKKENKLLGINDTSNWEGKYDIEKIAFTGFIAQEVDAAAGKIGYDFSGVDKSGKVLGLRYSDFVVPMVKAVQELDQENKKLKVENSDQQKEIDELKSKVDQLQSFMINNQSPVKDDATKISIGNETIEPLLGQNIPNPFDNSTVIPFRIPEGCTTSAIVVSETSTGRIITAIPVSCMETHVTIESSTLASGSYTYTLYVDGKVIDTRRMELLK
ncbi:MAG TPA: tail fiber domain-containing protein, partial [Chitinophagales bacterium]|nr:tail fiber domain-containing protein [Chitinophagales bacterium]